MFKRIMPMLDFNQLQFASSLAGDIPHTEFGVSFELEPTPGVHAIDMRDGDIGKLRAQLLGEMHLDGEITSSEVKELLKTFIVMADATLYCYMLDQEEIGVLFSEIAKEESDEFYCEHLGSEDQMDFLTEDGKYLLTALKADEKDKVMEWILQHSVTQ